MKDNFYSRDCLPLPIRIKLINKRLHGNRLPQLGFRKNVLISICRFLRLYVLGSSLAHIVWRISVIVRFSANLFFSCQPAQASLKAGHPHTRTQKIFFLNSFPLLRSCPQHTHTAPAVIQAEQTRVCDEEEMVTRLKSDERHSNDCLSSFSIRRGADPFQDWCEAGEEIFVGFGGNYSFRFFHRQLAIFKIQFWLSERRRRKTTIFAPISGQLAINFRPKVNPIHSPCVRVCADFFQILSRAAEVVKRLCPRFP